VKMMDDKLDFYSKFDNIHGKVSRKEWYNHATKAYMETRPKYPHSLILEALQEAKLLNNKCNRSTNSSSGCSTHHILEIGCGPGTSTVPLAKLGYHITAIDPAPQNCMATRQQCIEFEDRVKIVETTFENFAAPNSHDDDDDDDVDTDTRINVPQFSAIVCATLFHWIPPDAACQKTAELLRPLGGCLMLWWALPPQPSADICQFLQDIYDEMGETNLGQQQQQQNIPKYSMTSSLDGIRVRINESGLDETNHTLLELEEVTLYYSPEKYITLLSTLSPYIALTEKKRFILLEKLLVRLEKFCHHYGQSKLKMKVYFAKQCFWVKNQT
jgi:SAM-dependent methyltransferase